MSMNVASSQPTQPWLSGRSATRTKAAGLTSIQKVLPTVFTCSQRRSGSFGTGRACLSSFCILVRYLAMICAIGVRVQSTAASQILLSTDGIIGKENIMLLLRVVQGSEKSTVKSAGTFQQELWPSWMPWRRVTFKLFEKFKLCLPPSELPLIASMGV